MRPGILHYEEVVERCSDDEFKIHFRSIALELFDYLCM